MTCAGWTSDKRATASGGTAGQALNAKQKAAQSAVDHLYEVAVSSSSAGPLLHLFLAQYVKVYCNNAHIEQLELKRLQSLSLPLDIEFFVYQRNREVKRSAKATRAAGSISVEDHIKFSAMKVRVERQMLSARESLAELWEELGAKKPSLPKLDTLGSAMQRWTNEAVESFEAMLKINPGSVTTLRCYAQFLAEVSTCLLQTVRWCW